ncbi:MAG: cytochrome c oxidase assembly protein [Chloroflexota bacterium]
MSPSAWSWDSLILLSTGLVAFVYARGLGRIRRRTRRGAAERWRAASFGGGLAVLLLALESPINTYDDRLFSMHMLQHMLLVLGAAPLLLIGAPLVPLLWGLPDQERRGVGRLLSPHGQLHTLGHRITQPLVAEVLFLGTFAFWHVPPLYDSAQGRSLTHDLEHALLLGTALLFWWPLVQPTDASRRMGHGLAVAYLAAASVEGTVIGALLTFSSEPLYTTYKLAPRIVGLSVLQDQQLAGLIMWVPSGLVYLSAILMQVGLLLRSDEGNDPNSVPSNVTMRS